MEQPIFVRQHDAQLQWHEAVALVLSVTDALRHGRIRSVPTPGELALEIDGSLHLTSRAVTVRADGPRVTSDLRELLQELLPPDAPQALRALTESGEASATAGTLSDFREALAFFERPTSKEDLRALAARLSQDERQLETEIERLSRKARTGGQASTETLHAASPPPAGRASRKVLLVVALLAVAAAAAVVTLLFVPLPLAVPEPAPVESEASESSSTRTEAPEKGIIAKLSAAARSAFGSSTPPPKPAPEPVADSSAPAIQRPKPARPPAGAITTSPPQPPPRPPVAVFGDTPQDLFALPTLVPAWPPPELRPRAVLTIRAVDTPTEDPTVIHDRRDLDVVPPTLVRPHLPKVSAGIRGGAQPGTVEVVVGQDGRVEQVRLVRTSIERHYYDAMILAAVKAWVFRPATRDGQPVRYRLQIQLT